jgi:hypothetical protein
MNIIIKNISSKDLKFLREVVKRFGFESFVLSHNEKEDTAMSYAIRSGIKSGYIAEEDVLKTLKKKRK